MSRHRRNRAKREAAEHAVDYHWTCSICSSKTDTSSALKDHVRVDHNKCLRCKIIFNSSEEFQEHLSKAKWHKSCAICKLDFSSARGLAEHHHDADNGVARRISTAVTADVSYACDFCSKSFEVEEKLEAHLQREHIRCFPCSREFRYKKSLFEHLDSSSRHHFCSVCDTDFLTSEALHKHRTSHVHDVTEHRRYLSADEEDDDEEACYRHAPSYYSEAGSEYAKAENSLHRLTGFLDQLEEYYPEYANIVRIQNLTNQFFLHSSSDEEEFDDDGFLDHPGCYVCGEEFDNPLDKEFHEYDNHQWCVMCSKQFASRKLLNEHILLTKGHNFCFECENAFLLKEMLDDHRKFVCRSTGKNEPLVMSDVGVKKKVYVCDECDIDGVYSSELDLQRHLDRNHFKCLDCDKNFKSRKALIQHYAQSKRHHFCAECEMSLPSRQELNEHLRVGRHRD